MRFGGKQFGNTGGRWRKEVTDLITIHPRHMWNLTKKLKVFKGKQEKLLD